VAASWQGWIRFVFGILGKHSILVGFVNCDSN
jgi:hypothetical protein